MRFQNELSSLCIFYMNNTHESTHLCSTRLGGGILEIINTQSHWWCEDDVKPGENIILYPTQALLVRQNEPTVACKLPT